MSASRTHRPAMPLGFRFTLRQETRSEHAALDSHPAFAALMDGTLSVEGYRRLMFCFHGFYVRHDSMLADACERYSLESLGFSYAPRAGALAKDLAGIGGAAWLYSQTWPATLPSIDSIGRLAGFLYVLEGSMLGGAVLHRAVEALLASRQMADHGYWSWCRDAGPTRWKMTCQMLDRVAAAELAQAQMIDGAKAAFMTFAEWLDCWQDEPRVAAGSTEGFLRC